jgi:hypothetical protein
MRPTPTFTADASVYESRGRYAAERSGRLEPVILPAQRYSLSAGEGPRFVWSGGACPPGERFVCVGPTVRVKLCGGHPCGWETVPGHCECWPDFHVISGEGSQDSVMRWHP